MGVVVVSVHHFAVRLVGQLGGGVGGVVVGPVIFVRIKCLNKNISYRLMKSLKFHNLRLSFR